MFHLAAYAENIGAPAPSAILNPVADGFLPATDSGFLMPSELKVVASYAAHENIQNARLVAPSLLRTAYPYIHPVQGGTTAPSAPSDPNLQRSLVTHPLQLKATENVSAEMTVGTGTGDLGVVLLWLCQQLTRVPAGEKFTLRFEKTATPTTALQWTSIGTVTFDQSLPAGTYAIAGFAHAITVPASPPAGVAARLLLPGSIYRPGTLSMSAIGDRTDPLFLEGGLGVFGTFSTFAPPQVEVLTRITDPNTTHEVYLTVIRIGEAQMIGCPPGPGPGRPETGTGPGIAG